MALTTNAGIVHDEKYEAARRKDHNVQIVKDAVRREMRNHGGRKLEVKQESEVVVINSDDGGLRPGDIQKLDYLRPVALIEDPGWPDGTGVRKDLPTLAWEAILLHRVFCFKCRWRLKWAGADCHRCHWTQDQTTAAMQYLHKRGFVRDAGARRRKALIDHAARRSA